MGTIKTTPVSKAGSSLDDTPVLDGMAKPPSPRRSVLDLAPLELDCMNTLWPIGEATVRQIREGLAPRRARAYTTIMTIMDRLARKGVVERKKTGRAYVYRPRLSAQEARTHALAQVLDNFFGGSKEALLAQLENTALAAAPLIETSSPVVSADAPHAAAPEGGAEFRASAQEPDRTVV
jgi:predicted transcriptional regulator